MNGVRRFLGAATASTSSSPPSATVDPPTAPLSFSAKAINGPSWPPSSPTTATPPTPPLSFKKEPSRQRFDSPPPPDGEQTRTSTSDSNFRQSAGSSSSPSSSRVPPNRLTLRKTVAHSQSPPDADWKRSSAASSSSGTANTRDELLLSLLASQAVVDSREFEILGSEQIDDLTKEHHILTSRLEAMSKKLTLETKIRDAAVSLTKVNAAHKRVSKQTEEQLKAANSRVDAAQRDLWRISERAHEVHRRLLEHRAGVLSHSVRSMEKKIGNGPGTGAGEDSGYDSSNRSTLMSPTTSSMTGFPTSSKARFDGLHLFAGHVDTIVPRRQLSSEAAAAEITVLEEKLKAATVSLTAAGKKQAELTRELLMMKLEKQEVETMMGMDLQSAEETIKALEMELPKLQGLDGEVQELREERKAWGEERTRLQEQTLQVQVLRTRLEEMETNRGGLVAGSEKELSDSRRMLQEKEEEIRRITAQWQAEREVWERRKAEAEDEKIDELAQLQQEMDAVRDEDDLALRQAHGELDAGLDALRTLVQQHGIVLFSRDSSLQGLLSSVGTHLETVHTKLESHARAENEWETVRRKLEEDVRAGLDKREALARDLEYARQERDGARDSIRAVERVSLAKDPSSLQSPVSPLASSDSVGRITQVLTPLWNILPSPEARAAKFNNTRAFRTGSPTLDRNGASAKPVASLSELDVRSLKSLYDSTRQPMSPMASPGEFSIEAFAARVQALIQDDRALIERLLRFAQAHDLLKKNAERAQKLAHEGNAALETYQKQVRILEERNMTMAAKQAALLEELQQLQSSLERIENEKREVEMLALEQAETCKQLTEANNTLSARTLTLAEEAASAPEMVRRHLEGQLSETRAALESAQDEVEAMRTSEQSQRIALLDELNSMQTENGQLRAQLRARK
ncbi:Up-regulated during septation-domain-containing protein [Lyophyllum atratum]|nr:Up-regulated during septation-domain-containing protein [Lyophyllum atratum]